MSASSIPREKTVERNSGGSGFQRALWLAQKDIRRAWLSYPASGLFVCVIGVLITSSVDGILFEVESFGEGGQRTEDAFDSFLADYMFLIIGAVLAVNALSRDYMSIWTDDVFSQRLSFLRRLPASTGSLVASRAMSMLFALPFTVPAFFLPIYFLSDLGEMGFSYVWFCGIWLGWSLAYAGLTLLCELAMNGRVYVWFSVAFIIGLIAILAFLEWAVRLGLVERSANLALEHGPLAAIVSLLAGGAAFALFARAAAKRIERRDLP